MPHVIIKLWPGKSEQQKTKLADQITRNIMETLENSEASVSIAIEEIDPQEWAEKVYQPDIQGSLGKLYKKPGYTM